MHTLLFYEYGPDAAEASLDKAPLRQQHLDHASKFSDLVMATIHVHLQLSPCDTAWAKGEWGPAH